MFQSFIDFKKVHHFVKDMAGKLSDIFVNVVSRFAEGDRDDLFVRLPVVGHIDHADRITLHERGGQNGLAA